MIFLKRLLKKLGFSKLYYFLIRVRRRIKLFFSAFSFYLYNSFITNVPSYRLRTFYLRRILGIKIGRHTSIHMGCFFAGSKIVIGNNTVLDKNCYLDGRVGLITIGNNVSIAHDTQIISLTHITNSPTFEVLPKNVIISDFSWIGARALVLPGVHMAKGSVLGAGSTATKNFDEYGIYVGNPAKKIGQRNPDLNYTLNYFPFFNSDICG